MLINRLREQKQVVAVFVAAFPQRVNSESSFEIVLRLFEQFFVEVYFAQMTIAVNQENRVVNLLADIQCFASKYFPEYISVIDYQLEKTKPRNSYAEIISKRFGDGYMEKGIELAGEYQRSVGYV